MTADAESNNLTFTILIHDGSAGQGGKPEIVFSDGVVSSFPQYQGPACVQGGSPFMILTMNVTYMTLGVPDADPSSSLFLLTDAGDLVGIGVDSQVDSQVILTRPSPTS